MRKMFAKAIAVTCMASVGLPIVHCTGRAHEQAGTKKQGPVHADDGVHDEKGHERNAVHAPSVVKITKAQAQRFGIKIAEAAEGSLNRVVRVPGEIRLDEEKAVHIVTQLSGIVRSSRVKVGDKVRAGQVLAVLESRELAEAKAAFLAATKRERLARDFYEREERLWKKQVTSEQEYLTARQVLAERSIEKKSARQQLLALGVPKSSIGGMSESEDNLLSSFVARAPINGQVLEKHLTLGESLPNGTKIFVIADLSTVWLDLTVGHEDLAELREGLAIDLALPGKQKVEAKVAYVSPVANPETRTVTVRAVVENEEGLLRPGLFVQADIRLPSEDKALLVHKGSVQNVNDHPCVFVWNKGVFELREIVPGVSDNSRTEVLQGLTAGEKIAAKNAFHLKAEYVKAAGGNTGCSHGHAH
ncbi:MAG: efflux RND transporter periplasmic adaptor subunit [Chitinivibrionales bacterium]|nr:efflux RND transporter periplasmic adaptor subunit [Chitinivibrionales bacterium]